MIKKLILLMLLIAFVSQVSAIDSDKQDRLDFGYVLYLKSITTEPMNLVPGQSGVITVVLENRANFPLYDIRTEMTLPPQISFYEDISKRKIPVMEAGELEEIKYNVIVVPNTPEGVYDSSFMFTYLNHVATERQENDSFGIVVKTKPKIFAEIESTNLYSENKIGDLTINFVNNDISNIKFLTVELTETKDFEILEGNKKYIGDLDSDDFQSVDFKLKLLNSNREVTLPVTINYKDSFNKEYSEPINLVLKVRDQEEVSNQSNSTGLLIGLLIVVIIVVIVIFTIRKRKHKIKQ